MINNNEMYGFFGDIWSEIKSGLGLNAPSALQSGETLQQIKQLYSYTYRGGVLKEGDTGTLVKTLQYALNILGYHTYNTKYPDGIFGPMTKAAVIDFQRKNGLVPTGIFDKYTAYALYKKIYNATQMASFLPKVINTWVQNKIQQGTEHISKEYPNYFKTQKTGSQTVIQPVEHTDWKPILIGGGIILAALLMSKGR